MKVRVIENYFDLQLKKTVTAGDEFEVSEARAEELTSANNKAGRALCELVRETPEASPGSKRQPKKKAVKNE